MRHLSLAVAVALLVALPAAAITYGQNDGNRHPNVGALVWIPSSGASFPFCSGTLISPTVFLTAAHCDPGVARINVTFDPYFSSKSKLIIGTYYADPRYSQAQDDPHDIAVVVFDQPVRITPARLPGAGSLSSLSVGQPFTAVGYGAQEVQNQPG